MDFINILHRACPPECTLSSRDQLLLIREFLASHFCSVLVPQVRFVLEWQLEVGGGLCSCVQVRGDEGQKRGWTEEVEGNGRADCDTLVNDQIKCLYYLLANVSML